MPPRERDGLFHRAEQNLRDAVITFENGRRIEVPEIRAMSIEFDGDHDEIAIASAGAQEATFNLEGVDLNDMQDVIEEMARQRAEAEFQTFAAAMQRLTAESRDALDAMAQAAKVLADGCGTGFMEALNNLWENLDEDFELADEEAYVATDPISFDELMGGIGSDN